MLTTKRRKHMLKKLLLLLLLSCTLFATSNLGMYYNTNNNFLGIYPIGTSTTINENPQDWVGVFSKNSSNEWDNVIQWAWVTNLDSYAFDNNGVTKHAKIFPNQGLTEGEYVIKYFLNNSYDTYKSQTFEIVSDGEKAQISIVSQTDSTIKLNSTYQANEEFQTWIGIYKKDASNKWRNVQGWSWITKSENSFDIATLESGVYEARLFYNNSYHVEQKVEFSIVGTSTPYIEIKTQTPSSITLNTTFEDDKTWIGIYKKGVSNDWANVQSWTWVTQNNTKLSLGTLESGIYEARLFYNNSYIVEDSVAFKLENTGIKVTREDLDRMITNDEDYSLVDVSGITDMSWLFANKEAKYDISGWDVSHVTNMERMFSASKSFNQAIGTWDVSHVTNMRRMFYWAESFSQDLSNWDVSHVVDHFEVFYVAYRMLQEYKPKFNDE